MGILSEFLEKFEISVKTETESILHGQKISTPKSTIKVEQERNTNEEIFYNSSLKQPPSAPPINVAQISIKKASYLPLQHSETPLRNTWACKEIIQFLIKEPYINIYNFNRAEKILIRFIDFKGLTDINELKNKLLELQEQLDKSTSSQDKFGKALVSWSLKTHGLKLTLTRPKLKGFKQYIAINFNKEEEITVLNCWAGKHEKNEFIKSRCRNSCHKKHQTNSINFDAEVWKSFNHAGITLKNYSKSLECLERNRNTLPELIQEINRKHLMQVIHEPLMNNVTIKTDNNETAFLSFRTNTAQKVDIKLCNYASSLTISR